MRLPVLSRGTYISLIHNHWSVGLYLICLDLKNLQWNMGNILLRCTYMYKKQMFVGQCMAWNNIQDTFNYPSESCREKWTAHPMFYIFLVRLMVFEIIEQTGCYTHIYEYKYSAVTMVPHCTWNVDYPFIFYCSCFSPSLVTCMWTCKHGNEPSGSLKYWELLEWLHNWRLLKEGSAAQVSLT
jgi:hypothetical protein